MASCDWDMFYDIVTVQSGGAIGDVIQTPAYDLNQVNPNTNRVNLQKLSAVAAADTLSIQMSNDKTNWYTCPLYNGGTGGGIATTATSATELSLVGLPAMRYIRGVITVAGTALSGRGSIRLNLAFLRY